MAHDLASGLSGRSISPRGSTWWRERWRNELVPAAQIVIAEADGAMIGFVTVDPATLYLDQIVVAPEFWGSGVGAALVAEAKRLSPNGLDLDVNTDNARAIRFYSDADLRSAAPAKIRSPASRFIACAGGRTAAMAVENDLPPKWWTLGRLFA